MGLHYETQGKQATPGVEPAARLAAKLEDLPMTTTKHMPHTDTLRTAMVALDRLRENARGRKSVYDNPKYGVMPGSVETAEAELDAFYKAYPTPQDMIVGVEIDKLADSHYTRKGWGDMTLTEQQTLVGIGYRVAMGV